MEDQGETVRNEDQKDETEKMGDQKHMNMLSSNSPVRQFAASPLRPFAGAPVRKCAMGEGVVTQAPHIISSVGLGSCVAVTFYDTSRKIGGLAHIMLPNRIRNPQSAIRNEEVRNPQYQCADTAIAALLEELRSKGAVRQDLVAKMVGGAQMFSSYDGSNSGVGKQNLMSIKRILDRERIPLIGEDVGGHHGRNIEFYLGSGKVIVMAMGKGDREI